MRRLIVLAMLLTILLIPQVCSATVLLEKIEGYIPGEYREESFTIDCQKDLQYVEFAYPTYSDFWVKVLGMHGDLLGDFQLSEGEVIELSGGGLFTLIVYSKKGSGVWTAVIQKEEEGTSTD